MTTFRNLYVSWENVTSYTQAKSSQAQQSLQAAFSRGRQARNFGPQEQESAQQDSAVAIADITAKIPRALENPPEDNSGDIPAADVILQGYKLHAVNENTNTQTQALSQDAVMDSPVPAYDAPEVYDSIFGPWEGVNEDPALADPPEPRLGANNIADQSQSNIQDKKASAVTRTRLIELVDYPERRRAGTIYDISNVRARTSATNDQVQDLSQRAIVNEQYYPHAVRIGANNIAAQSAHSIEHLQTEAKAGIKAPLDDTDRYEAVGTGTYHGSVAGLSARSYASNSQVSAGNQVALDQNIGGGNGEAFNVLPQVQTNEQLLDTAATVYSRPRSSNARDDSAIVTDIASSSKAINDQAQVGSQASEVTSVGPATNDMPQQQANIQASNTVTRVDIVF